jgi:membrane-bound lytic murein transglycosylase D
VLVVLAGCATVRPAAAPATTAPIEAAPAVQSPPPATPVIPDPVPVDVAPAPVPASPAAEAEIAAEVPQETPAQPETEAEPRDLLKRVRSGMSLGEFRNSRVDKEADWFARNPEYVERVFTRAAPYFHYIVSQVEARGMPLEIALLPIIESAFQPYAYSKARATGLWQFMAATGGRFGLKQDWWYDGRRDVVAATQAALDYLQYLNDMFEGDWLHAIAAYNCGEGNVSRAIKRNLAARKRTDFWNLKLPAETQGYVPRLLAMSRIVADPELYGLSIEGMRDEPACGNWRPDQHRGGRRTCGRHHRRNVRPESGPSSLGHGPDRTAFPAGAGRGRHGIQHQPAAADARPAHAGGTLRGAIRRHRHQHRAALWHHGAAPA